MKTEIKVPQMGESISEVTIGEILKNNGSYVKIDEEVLEIETDKVNQALFAPASGVLEIKVKTGDVVSVGELIGFVDSSDEVKESKTTEKKQEKELLTNVKETPKISKIVEKEAPRISKKEAISELLKEDLSKELPRSLTKKADVEIQQKGRIQTRKKLSQIRKVIAERLVEAKNQTAMLTTFNEVDMTEIIKLRDHYKEEFLKHHGVKLGFMSFFVKAVQKALAEFPNVNSYIEGNEIVHFEYFDIGIAVGTDRGLVVPVIKDVDRQSFAEIESSIENFAAKAKNSGLTVDDLKGGSFTITNGGVYGSLLSTPIINYPQTAILGMHKIMKRAVVVDDQIVIRPMMYLALSYDHRLIDGKEAVSFLVMVKNILEDPSRLLLDV